MHAALPPVPSAWLELFQGFDLRRIHEVTLEGF